MHLTQDEILDLLADAATIGRNGELDADTTRGDIKTDVAHRLRDKLEALARREQVMLVHGSPFEGGLQLVGPVTPNDPALEKFTDEDLRDDYWWYVPFVSLAEARTH